MNSAPLTAEALRGKVVLVDFWDTPASTGFGPCHLSSRGIATTPRSAWSWSECTRRSSSLQARREHRPRDSRPRADVSDRDHNQFAIWRALGNDAWPTKFLFDANGRLVRRWAGEGRYDEIESEIRRLLVAANTHVQLPAVSH